MSQLTDDQMRELVRANPMRATEWGEVLGWEQVTASRLNVLWDVNAEQSYYSEDGTFYNPLTQFPGALFDDHGYVVFETERDYLRSPYLRRGRKLHVDPCISAMPGYRRMAPP